MTDKPENTPNQDPVEKDFPEATTQAEDDLIVENAGKKKKGKGYLKAAFTGAVVMGGISFVAKAAVGCAAVPGWGGILLAAAASGLALTGYTMVKDYRAAKPTLPADMKFSKFVTSQWKHYTKTFAVKTGFSALGALAFVGVGELLEHTAVGQTVKEAFCHAAQKVGGFFGFGGSAPVEAPTAPDSVDTPVTDNTAGIDSNPDIAGAPNPLETMIKTMECADLTPEGQRIYEGLLNGEPWAMESAGVGSLNGSYGIPCVDSETAIALIECAAQSGNENAMIDMAYFQYHGLHGIEMDREKALDVICGLGRSWVGGEHLIGGVETVTNASYDTVADAAVSAEPAAVDVPQAEPFNGEFEIVGECQITSPTDAVCTMDQSTVSGGEGMRFNASNGLSYIFGLEPGAGAQSADRFQTDKLVHAINLAYTPQM